MVIGIDAGALSVTDDRLKVGVYRVTREALRALVALDRENSYRLYSFGEIRGIRVKEVRLPRVGWSKVWLPLELKKHPVDVFLGLAQALPFSKTSYNIGFIYDLGFLYHPEAYGIAAKILKQQTDELVRRASHIITISHATKSDVLREYGLPAKKVSVAYPGVDSHFRPEGEKHIGGHPYFLFVGSLNKAKDIPTLLRSFARFLKSVKKVYDLYLVGGDYWPDPAINETIRLLGLADRVKILGFIPDDKLSSYYRGALAFVTTALREGFCLPAAEAMACGTPVVALDRGALREVVGAGGIIISSKSKVQSVKETFAEAMINMTDKKARDVLARKAIAQVKKFRWESFAQHILNNIHHGYKTD